MIFIVRMKTSSLQMFALAVAVCLAACAGCGTRQEPPCGPGGPPPPVSILAPALSNRTAQASEKMLRKLFPDARWIAGREIDAGLASCLRENRVLIVPDIEHVPFDWWSSIKSHLDDGGATVFLGCEPFGARVRLVEGAPQEERAFREGLLRTARASAGFSSVRDWRHLSSRGAPSNTVQSAPRGSLPWPGVLVEARDFGEWDVVAMDPIPHGAIGHSENSLVFYARGSAGTAHLAVECFERDGSCWTRTVTVSESWQPYIIHQASFNYAYGGRNRGTKGNHLALSRARKISIGLSQGVSAQAPGDLFFGVSDVRLAADPRSIRAVVSWPDIFMLSPPYRHYGSFADHVECMATGQRWPIGRARVQGPLPRSLGAGGETAAPYRWIPMFRTANAEGHSLCWPASLHVEPQTNGATKKWAWVGVDVSKASAEAAAAMTLACAQRLAAGAFLYKAGCPEFSFEPEAPVRASARWTAPAGQSAGLRVCAELYKRGDDFLRRRVVGLPPDEAGISRINLGRSPLVEETAEDYILRILLEDSTTPGRILDRVDQPLKFLTLPRTPGEQEWVTAAGARFAAGRRPVFLLGVNYWPRTTNGRMPDEFTAHWLDSSEFDPDLIRRDLAQLEEAGINAVSIQYLAPEQAPQLRFFVEEARKLGIWVHLFLPGLDPLAPDLKRAEQLIEAADLKNEAQVFALDLAWEPHLGEYKDRRRFDGDWREWLQEQYGSIEHAEQLLGRSLWKSGGLVTGPPDSELAAEGKADPALAAYRRFVHDFTSRRYGYVVRWLRARGIRQLLGARTGYGGTGQPWAEKFVALDPATGAAHLDFISPEGWGLSGTPDSFMEAGFITAYCRGVSAGKPVLWAEFGSSVGANPQTADLENQARIYRNMFEMVLKSRSAGCFGWWFPSGWRVGERSDMGIVNPDGSWRPAGSAYRNFAHRLRAEWIAPAAWRGREIDADGNASGLPSLWNAWRDTYRTETSEGRTEELRPLNFGKRTSEINIRSLGGAPYSAPAPIQSLNSEWGRIECDGVERDRAPGHIIAVNARRKVRMELINTGPAAWDASAEGKTKCVWVRLESEKGERQQIPVGALRFGASAFITWTAPDPGTWRAQPFLADVGPFGEPLQIEVLEGTN